MESTMNKRIDGFQNKIAQTFDNLQYSISRLTNQHQVQDSSEVQRSRVSYHFSEH